MQTEKFDLLLNHPNRRYKIGRNPSWRNSISNGLTAGLWWIPQSALMTVRQVLVPIGIGAAWGIGVVVLMILYHLLWLCAGLTGFLRDEAAS